MADINTPRPLLEPDTFRALLAPGAARYFTDHDHLKLTIFTSLAVTVTARGLFCSVATGQLQEFAQDFIPAAADRSANVFVMPMEEGWLVDLHVLVTSGAPQVGQTYVIASVVRGLTSTAFELSPLVANYVTVNQRASFPRGAIVDSMSGPGALRSILGAVPGAGAELSVVVPARTRWQLLSLFYSLTTAVAVANRESSVAITDGVNIIAWYPAGVTQAASLVENYTFASGVARYNGSIGLKDVVPLGQPTWLGAGFQVLTNTTAIQAADQYTAPDVVVREWIAVP